MHTVFASGWSQERLITVFGVAIVLLLLVIDHGIRTSRRKK